MSENLTVNSAGQLEGELELYGERVSGVFTPEGHVPDGVCTVRFDSGVVARVLFQDGRVVKKQSVELPDGVEVVFAEGSEQAGYRGSVRTAEYTYEGELDARGRPHGTGAVRYAFGASRRGQFSAGEPAGLVTSEYVPGVFATEDFSQDPPALAALEGRGAFLARAGQRLYGLAFLDGGRAEYRGYLDTQGLPSGLGVEDRAGTLRKGLWERGRFVREEVLDGVVQGIRPRFAVEGLGVTLPTSGLEERVLGGARVRGKWISGQLHGLASVEENGGAKHVVQFDYGVIRRRLACRVGGISWEFEAGSEASGQYSGVYESAAEGYRYAGGFDSLGRQDGRGRRVYDSGEVLEAEFCHGVPSGRVFRLVGASGDYWVSWYEAGEKVRDVQVKLGDCYWYFDSGDCVGGYQGEMVCTGKYRYVGAFHPDGTQHGPGVRTGVSGEIIEGVFKEGFVDGKALHTYPGGRKVAEEYDMGKLTRVL